MSINDISKNIVDYTRDLRRRRFDENVMMALTEAARNLHEVQVIKLHDGTSALMYVSDDDEVQAMLDHIESALDDPANDDECVGLSS